MKAASVRIVSKWTPQVRTLFGRMLPGDSFQYPAVWSFRWLVVPEQELAAFCETQRKEPVFLTSCPFFDPPSRWKPGEGLGFPQQWLFREFFVEVMPEGPLSADESKLLVIEAVLKREQRFQKLSQLATLEQKLAKASRREPIPDEVKMFVWRRDQGRCVKCGAQEGLEFDQ